MTMRPDDHRRKWDKDEFERIAADRLKAEIEEEERSKKKGTVTNLLVVTSIILSTKRKNCPDTIQLDTLPST